MESQRLECSNLNGEEQGRHLWSFKEPACRRVIRPHDYLNVILLHGAVDPVLVIGEGGGSSELALLEAVLKKHGKSSGQEVFGYDGHLQSGRGEVNRGVMTHAWDIFFEKGWYIGSFGKESRSS